MYKLIQLPRLNRLIKKASKQPIVKLTKENVHEFNGCLLLAPSNSILYIQDGSVSYKAPWESYIEVDGFHNHWLETGHKVKILKTGVFAK